MPPEIVALAWLPIVVIVVAMVVITTVLRRRRRRKISGVAALAAQYGWQLVEYDVEMPRQFRGDPFCYGDNRTAQHILRGTYRGYEMAAFEYAFVSEAEFNDETKRSTHFHSVVTLSTPRARPFLQVRRENLRSRLRGMVGVHDLRLGSDGFDRAFLVETENDRFAYDVLHPRMMEWMLADQRTKEQPFRFEGDRLVLWRGGTLRPEWIVPTLDLACDILDRVPGSVWVRYGS
ncbi:hypothetical protein GCM10029964_121810 [Kibdelosporangium lantanae]